MSRRAREASDRLTRALLDLAAAGLRTHCSDPRHTTSGCPSARANGAAAVMLCDHCPVLQACQDTAVQRDERWGVWGGVDFTRPRKP
jgi:hypothetical protein